MNPWSPCPKCAMEWNAKWEQYEIVFCPVHAAASDMVHRLRQAAAVLRWYAIAFGNAGGAEYQASEIDSLLARLDDGRDI